MKNLREYLPAKLRLFLGLSYNMDRSAQALAHIRLLLLGILIAIVFSVSNANAGGTDSKNACDEAAVAAGKDCEVVKVLTKCDMDKYKLQKKIEQLRRELRELEVRKERIEIRETVKEVPVYVERIVVKKVVKKETKIKKHILSLFAHRSATSSSSRSSSSGGTHSATAEVGTEYAPGLMYQYQFDMGLVPMIGVDTELDLIFGLGFEF